MPPLEGGRGAAAETGRCRHIAQRWNMTEPYLLNELF